MLQSRERALSAFGYRPVNLESNTKGCVACAVETGVAH
jgi:hypothetical protein